MISKLKAIPDQANSDSHRQYEFEELNNRNRTAIEEQDEFGSKHECDTGPEDQPISARTDRLYQIFRDRCYGMGGDLLISCGGRHK